MKRKQPQRRVPLLQRPLDDVKVNRRTSVLLDDAVERGAVRVAAQIAAAHYAAHDEYPDVQELATFSVSLAKEIRERV